MLQRTTKIKALSFYHKGLAKQIKVVNKKTGLFYLSEFKGGNAERAKKELSQLDGGKMEFYKLSLLDGRKWGFYVDYQ